MLFRITDWCLLDSSQQHERAWGHALRVVPSMSTGGEEGNKRWEREDVGRKKTCSWRSVWTHNGDLNSKSHNDPTLGMRGIGRSGSSPNYFVLLQASHYLSYGKNIKMFFASLLWLGNLVNLPKSHCSANTLPQLARSQLTVRKMWFFYFCTFHYRKQSVSCNF